MKVLRNLLFSILYLILVGFGAGCTPPSSEPQQIAAFPQSPEGDWYLPARPEGGRLVYDAYMALEVRDPEASAAEAIHIAETVTPDQAPEVEMPTYDEGGLQAIQRVGLGMYMDDPLTTANIGKVFVD